MNNLRSNLIRVAATFPKGSQERKALLDVLAADVKCDGGDGGDNRCGKPIVWLDNQGYVYCEQHGNSLKNAGRKGMRKIRPAEIKKLEQGQTVKYAASTWLRRLQPIQDQFLIEVATAARDIFESAGGGSIRLHGAAVSGELNGDTFEAYWYWDNGKIFSQMQLGLKTRKGMHLPLSLSPEQVASASVYAHFQGLLH